MLYDYTRVTPESVTAATEEALAAADNLIEDIVSATERTWETTMAPLDEAAAIVDVGYGRGPFMARVHTDPDVRARANEMEERLTKWGTDLVFRRDLYEAVHAYAATEEAAGLEGIRERFLDVWKRDFRRAGHELPADKRNELQRLRRRLVELEVGFGRNLDEYDDALVVTRDDLAGLPEDYIARLRPGPEAGTWRISMDYPDYNPFMEQAERRDLRKVLQHKFWNRAVEANRELLAEAVEVRNRIAALLGYPTWADYAIEVKMAKHPKAVEDFYAGLVDGLMEKGRLELADLQGAFAREHPEDTLESWDWSYYHNRIRRERFGVDPNEVAAYFPLAEVFQGMLDLTSEVFGLEYRRVEPTMAWHDDVMLYEIRDRGAAEPRAYFYADLFPRDGKYGHAAAFGLVYGRSRSDGEYEKPIAAIVANLTKPTENHPSLLKHEEVRTLFHEFGHILHFCLTDVELMRFSGYDTEWDFVEAPSQIMEHWIWQPEVLQRFARHHQTGEPIPTELVERMLEARDLNVGLLSLRQVYLGRLDLDMHDSGGGKDLDSIYREAYALTLLPFHEDTFFPASFGHVMGGYDAGYYGYLWAKVFGDDMFSVFEDEGIASPDVGARYRQEILAAGGSRDAMDHLRAFLGREPSSEAFLRNIGLAGHREAAND